MKKLVGFKRILIIGIVLLFIGLACNIKSEDGKDGVPGISGKDGTTTIVEVPKTIKLTEVYEGKTVCEWKELNLGFSENKYIGLRFTNLSSCDMLLCFKQTSNAQESLLYVGENKFVDICFITDGIVFWKSLMSNRDIKIELITF